MNARGTNKIESASSFVLLTVVCAVLAGCSSSPSAGDGERAIQDRIRQESEGRIRLTNFQKDNGAQGELMGFKIYRLEFTANVEFAEDCKWVTGFMGSQLGFRTTKAPAENQNALAAFTEASQNPGEIVRKEKGWAVDTIELSKGTPIGDSGRSPSQMVQQPSEARQTPQSLREKAEKGDATTAPADVALEESTSCINNLKQIGLAFRTWALDHDDKYPFNVSTNGGTFSVPSSHPPFAPRIIRSWTGGTMELCSPGSDCFDTSAPFVFRVMSEELGSTKILVCPSDSGKKPAADFEHLLSANVSYQVRSGPSVNDTNPNEILGRCPINGHILLYDGS